MTQKANPSVNRPAGAFKTAGAIAYGGHGDGGFIVGGATPTDLATQDQGIDETVLNAFDYTTSTTSLDVTIDPGEAFVFGSWVCKDTTTTVTLASGTAGQTVYVGWNKDGTNDVVVGLESTFATASGDTDQKIPIATFDTDGSGVTSVTDDRQLGQFISAEDIESESVTLGELLSLTPASTEPATPAGDDVALWNSGNAVEAKFSDGSTVTLAQQ